jgi:hypothetical protein
MGAASLAVLLYSGGDVSKLVVMYAINVFVTFSISQLGMTRLSIQQRRQTGRWWRDLAVYLAALVLCATILVVTILEKFTQGGWITLVTTGLLIGLCVLIRHHYSLVRSVLQRLDTDLPALAEPDVAILREPPDEPVAVLFVAAYGGLGRHMLLSLLRMFPGYFKHVMFVSIAIVDCDIFRGDCQLGVLEERTRQDLERYERFGRSLALKTTSRLAIGTEVAVEAERIATELQQRYPTAVFVAGQLVFGDDNLWNRLLHSETAFLIQRRLEHAGVPMIVLPVRVELKERRIV